MKKRQEIAKLLNVTLQFTFIHLFCLLIFFVNVTYLFLKEPSNHNMERNIRKIMSNE